MGRYYQKYFEDYEEERVPNKRGNGTHLQYTYKGFYYRQELNPVMQALLRVCYVVLFVLELYFFAKAGTKELHCNLNPVMALLQAFSMLGYVWLGWILFFYVSAPRDMTIYKYKSTAFYGCGDNNSLQWFFFRSCDRPAGIYSGGSSWNFMAIYGKKYAIQKNI